jgi:hypothetical protein
LLSSTTVAGIKPGDSIRLSVSRDDVKSRLLTGGRFSCLSVVRSPKDIFNDNDTACSCFYLCYPPGTVSINEFMPDVSPGNSEFIELYNSSPDTICLDGWSIYDGAALNSGKKLSVSSTGFVLPPAGYGVVAMDKSIFSCFDYLEGSRLVYVSASGINLNTSGDFIVIKEPDGNTQDSLHYSSDWHSREVETTKDRSLEKYNVSLPSRLASSWTTSGDALGASPLKPNSVSIEKISEGIISAAPNPFSPGGHLGENVCMISYRLPFRQARIKSEIYDTDGNILRNLVSNEFTASSGSFVWDGRNDSGFTQPPGAYVLFLEAIDTESNDARSYKLLIAIGD